MSKKKQSTATAIIQFLTILVICFHLALLEFSLSDLRDELESVKKANSRLNVEIVSIRKLLNER